MITHKMEEVGTSDPPISSNEYISSYNDINIHALMLKDRPRTLAYKNFIERNPLLFRDKIVIDIGAGTGILSIFAAKAGARKVFAIEGSDIAYICQAVVERNNMADVIEVIHEVVEQTDKLDGIKADVIISEWMGFYLFHESMLDTVIYARDKWLKADGVILPSTAVLYVCPVNMDGYYNDKVKYWNDVYGFDFRDVAPFVVQAMLQEPTIMSLEPHQLAAEPYPLKEIDLRTVKLADVASFSDTIEFTVTKHDRVHGFACWFDVKFTGNPSNVCKSNHSSQKPTDRDKMRHTDCAITDVDCPIPHDVNNCKSSDEIVDVDMQFIDNDHRNESNDHITAQFAKTTHKDDTDDRVSEKGDNCNNNSPCAKKSKMEKDSSERESISGVVSGRGRNSSKSNDTRPSNSEVTRHVLDVLDHHNIRHNSGDLANRIVDKPANEIVPLDGTQISLLANCTESLNSDSSERSTNVNTCYTTTDCNMPSSSTNTSQLTNKMTTNNSPTNEISPSQINPASSNHAISTNINTEKCCAMGTNLTNELVELSATDAILSNEIPEQSALSAADTILTNEISDVSTVDKMSTDEIIHNTAEEISTNAITEQSVADETLTNENTEQCTVDATSTNEISQSVVDETLSNDITGKSTVDVISSNETTLHSTNDKMLPNEIRQHPETNKTSTNEITLSTSPASEETHWKQTIVMLHAPLLVETGDTIRCRVEMAQDTTNKRHYNITVDMLDIESENESDDLDTEDHTVPCICDAPRCRIIRALMEKYDEQNERLCEESEPTITCAEIEAVDEGYDDMNDSVNRT